MEINPKEKIKSDIYKLLVGGVVPRPIAWITTKSKEGIVNAAPFSFFNVVAVSPPLLSVSVLRKSNGCYKDTARNILDTGEFIVNVVDESNIDQMNQTAFDYPNHVNELDKVGLSTLPGKAVSVPRIQTSKIHFECKLYQHHIFGVEPNSDLFIGEVVHISVDDVIYDGEHINMELLSPAGRLAVDDYITLGKVFTIPRPVFK